MTKQELEERIQAIIRGNQTKRPGQINAMMGLQLEEADPENKRTVFRFHAEPWTRNVYDIVHGGVIFSAMDSAMGYTVHALTGEFDTTVSAGIQYLRPAAGQDFLIEVVCTHQGRHIVSLRADFMDENRVILSEATGTYCLVDQGVNEVYGVEKEDW